MINTLDLRLETGRRAYRRALDSLGWRRFAESETAILSVGNAVRIAVAAWGQARYGIDRTKNWGIGVVIKNLKKEVNSPPTEWTEEDITKYGNLLDKIELVNEIRNGVEYPWREDKTVKWDTHTPDDALGKAKKTIIYAEEVICILRSSGLIWYG